MGFVGRKGLDVATARNISARKRLRALYNQGVEIRFDAEGGHRGPFDAPAGDDEVAMFIAPPNPLQRAEALREAQAARARALIAVKREENSEEHLTTMAFLAEMSNETLVEYMIASSQDARRAEAVRDVLARDEWKDFSSLQDAMRQFDESGASEDDPEWKDLLEKDREYGAQVLQRSKELTEADRESMLLAPRENIEKKALEKRGELVASQRFVEEYERQMMFFAVRDAEEHQQLFFDSPDEFSEQDDLIQDFIAKVINEFINDGTEAKNSQRAESGSDSSAPPSEPETIDPSTQKAATE